MNYNDRVKTPLPGSINTKCHAARVHTMESVLGALHTPLTNQCQSNKTSDIVRRHIKTRNVGPFSVTGFDLFLDILEEVFSDIKQSNLELYNSIDTAGCFCCRYVRGSNSQPSNHSWATGIDLTIKDSVTGKFVLDPRGDGKVQVGCLEIYKYFKAHGLKTGDWIFWGAGFPTEDGMHFEASNELILRWKKQGKI